MDIPYLTSLVIFLPTLGALLTLALRDASSIRWTALGTTTITFLLSIGLFVGYDPSVSTAMTTGPAISRAPAIAASSGFMPC